MPRIISEQYEDLCDVSYHDIVGIGRKRAGPDRREHRPSSNAEKLPGEPWEKGKKRPRPKISAAAPNAGLMPNCDLLRWPPESPGWPPGESRGPAQAVSPHLQSCVPQFRCPEIPVIPRYTRPEMGRIWSDENRFQTWLAVEVAATETLAEAGMVPREQAKAIRERAGTAHRTGLCHHRRGPGAAGRGPGAPRVGVQGHAPDRPHARHPRRAHYVRVQDCELVLGDAAQHCPLPGSSGRPAGGEVFRGRGNVCPPHPGTGREDLRPPGAESGRYLFAGDSTRSPRALPGHAGGRCIDAR